MSDIFVEPKLAFYKTSIISICYMSGMFGMAIAIYMVNGARINPAQGLQDLFPGVKLGPSCSLTIHDVTLRHGI